MSWFNLRVKVPRSDLDRVRTIIRSWPTNVAINVYYPALEQIAREGQEYMQYIILASETPTGRKRAGRGGNGPGRVDTGKLYDSVKYRVRQNKSNFSATVGWLDGKPGYAIFQELGTRDGVRGMEAIRQVNEYMYSEIRALASGRVSSTAVSSTTTG